MMNSPGPLVFGFGYPVTPHPQTIRGPSSAITGYQAE